MCGGGTNKSETEINAKNNKILTVDRLGEQVRSLVRAERSQGKSQAAVSLRAQTRDDADDDSDQSWKMIPAGSKDISTKQPHVQK